MFEKSQYDARYRDIYRFSWRFRDLRLFDGDSAPPNIVARLRPSLEYAAVFQQAIGLECAGQTDLVLLADLAQ
jgi:hypothetical protein